MNEHRINHQATTLGESNALVSGGWNQNEVMSSVEVYNQLLQIWVFTDAMSVPSTNFTMCDLDANYVIAAGGCDGITSNHASIEIYDYEDQMWVDGPDLSVGRSNLRSTKMLDGRVLCTGAYNGTDDQPTVDVYDPVINTMSAEASMASVKSSHEIVLLQSGNVMVIGEFNPDLGFQMAECEIYNPFLDEWSFFPNPVIDNVIINGPQFDFWRIYDIHGKVVLDGTVSMLSVPSLQSGRYIIEIHHDDFTSRLSLQRIKQ